MTIFEYIGRQIVRLAGFITSGFLAIVDKFEDRTLRLIGAKKGSPTIFELALSQWQYEKYYAPTHPLVMDILGSAIARKFVEVLSPDLALPIDYRIRERVLATIPDPDVMIEMLRRKAITFDDYLKFMKFHGYMTDWAVKYNRLRYRKYDIGMMMDLWRRGEIKDDEVDETLLFQGFDTPDREKIKKLK